MVNTSLRCIKPKSDQLRTNAWPLLYYHGPVVQQDRTPVCGTEVGVRISSGPPK